ncbi:hypothetical protein BZG02_02655 [Labilibaculum filiforme]|uniref:Uncharacterized protein n=1 Tax=Labilibaculum filiforme TaxID=1940526 RepID=A0A2N3I6H7_9BACT|nr:hypothetical protein BZG02_02655 [Labilibaculum filiforme]
MISLPTMFIHALARVSTRGFFKAPLGVWGVCRMYALPQLKQGTNDSIPYNFYSSIASGFNRGIF